MIPAVVIGPLSGMQRISSRSSPGDCSPGLSDYSAARQTGLLEKAELVGDLGGGQDPAGGGGVRIRRREVGEDLRRSHGRLVDTVTDGRAIPARDDEREVRVAR